MLNLFANPTLLISGLGIGFIFGFLLQKGRISHFNTIVGQLLFKDFTMLKIMLSAIIIGSIFLYASIDFGLIQTVLMPHSSKLAVIIGGLIMGTGLAISGYCPGTTFAAAGQGSKDAWFAALGLFIGACLYAEFYPLIKTYLLTTQPIDSSTLHGLLKISPWIIIVGLALATKGLFAAIDAKQKK